MSEDSRKPPVYSGIENLNEAFAFFESRTNLEKGFSPGNPNREYRLDRMRELCAAFGNPQESFRVVHLAGSKGKGSTAAYIAGVLHAAGREVGVYASPHLMDYRERFRIEGKDFPEDTAFETATMLLRRLPEVEGNLPGTGGATTFELLTLFAFLLFRASGCDTAVLETGLGGRLDATNVTAKPEAVVFTPIEKEHTEVLGSRLRDIALEKAGIIKGIPGCPVFSGYQHSSASRVIRRETEKAGLKLGELTSLIRKISATGRNDGKFAWTLKWKNGREDVIHLNMGGRIQAENAALALLVTEKLEPEIINTDKGRETTLKALGEVVLPGRFQRLRQNPVVIIDGAHTPHSVAAVAEAFRQLTSGKSERKENERIRPILLFGSVEGKDYKAMARKLCGGRHPHFREVIISTPGTFKPSNPSVVAESFRKTGADVSLIPDPEEAWKTAIRRSENIRPVLITGSFFMAGEIARLLH